MSFEGDRSEIYKTRENSKSFYINRFFNHYKRFVDLDRFKKEQKEYINDLIKLDRKLKNVDFSKSTLFFNSVDISREVFLTGFGRIEKLSTYAYYTIMDIVDIYMAHNRWDNPDIAYGEIKVSEQNIREDVLCLYGEDFMTHWNKSGFMISDTLSGREHNSKDTRRLINWFYYKGSYSGAVENPLTVDAVRYFENMKKEGYQIVDLNNLGIDFVSIRTSAEGSTNKAAISNKLSDIY